jgi:hypothetical protein
MTQLFRAAAPFAVPGTIARARGTTPDPRRQRRRHQPRCFAGAAALLCVGVLAGCADQLTSVPPPGIRGPALATASGYEQQYVVPYHPNSATDGSDDFPWTQSSITVPRAGRYRLRVQGSISSTVNPVFPNVCGGNAGIPTAEPTGTYGPMGKLIADVGNVMQVRVYTGQLPYSRFNQGFGFTTVDAQTMETVVTLPAGASLWTMFSGYSAWTWCGQYYPHYLFSGTHTLTATELAGATLECKGANGDTIVERGQAMRCALRSESPFRVLSRRAIGTGFTISEQPLTSHAAGTEHVWEGPAAASTQVQMVAEITEGGTTRQNTYTASFTVRPRTWPKLHLDPPVVTIGLRGAMTAYPNGTWGNGGPDMDQATLNAIPVTRPAAGPNTGVAFLTNPWPGVEFSIFLHPAMYNNPGNPTSPSQQWHVDQNGVGSGNCTQSLFAIMVPFAERHEGSTQASNSHFGITQNWYNNNNFEQNLEQIYKQTPRDVDVRKAAYDEFVRVHNTGTYNALHATFDAAETPAFMAAIGCTMDFNPGDP